MKLTDEAVEAAFMTLPIEAVDFVGLGEMRAALEAAAPHIQAQALEDAAYVFEGLPMNKGASISSGTYDWFELFPIQHMRDRAEDIRATK